MSRALRESSRFGILRVWVLKSGVSRSRWKITAPSSPTTSVQIDAYLQPTPQTMHPAPYTLHPKLCTLHPAPYTRHPAPYTLHPAPCTLHPAPYTRHPTPYTGCRDTLPYLHPTPCTLHPIYTQHPTPSGDPPPLKSALRGGSQRRDKLALQLEAVLTPKVPTPYTLHRAPYTLHPTPYTLHPTPCTLHPAPYTLHLAPYTLHLTPYTLHPGVGCRVGVATGGRDHP